MARRLRPAYRLAFMLAALIAFLVISGCDKSSDVNAGDTVRLADGTSLVAPPGFSGYLLSPSIVSRRDPLQDRQTLSLATNDGDEALRVQLISRELFDRVRTDMTKGAKVDSSKTATTAITPAGKTARVFIGGPAAHRVLNILIPSEDGRALWITSGTQRLDSLVADGTSPQQLVEEALQQLRIK